MPLLVDHKVKCSMILPVYISHRCTKKRVLVYALLDTMSDTSFITEDAMSILGIKGIPVNLSLSTLSNENELVQASKVSGLHVTGYKNDKGLNLGPVFSRLSIPVNRGHIPTFDKVKHWSHLQFLRSKLSPELDCPVGLIIGYDNSDALAPLFTTPSVNFGPYAQCTKLGWGVVGCVGHAYDTNGNHSLCTLSYQVFKPNGYSASHHSVFCFKTCVKQELSPWDMSMLLE